MINKDIVIATGNKHKLVEIQRKLGHLFRKIYTLKDLNVDVDVEENGATFKENALIKAIEYAKIVNMPVIADDSGLCCVALNGEPGVYSARYAGSQKDDIANNKKLLDKLNCVYNRDAYFQSVVVYYDPDTKKEIIVEGRVEGKISKEYPIGDDDFGYDPIFYCYELKKTFQEATLDEKNNISHRGRALNKLVEILERELDK